VCGKLDYDGYATCKAESLGMFEGFKCYCEEHYQQALLEEAKEKKDVIKGD
jgi:hypothetical protein